MGKYTVGRCFVISSSVNSPAQLTTFDHRPPPPTNGMEMRKGDVLQYSYSSLKLYNKWSAFYSRVAVLECGGCIHFSFNLQYMSQPSVPVEKQHCHPKTRSVLVVHLWYINRSNWLLSFWLRLSVISALISVQEGKCAAVLVFWLVWLATEYLAYVDGVLLTYTKENFTGLKGLANVSHMAFIYFSSPACHFYFICEFFFYSTWMEGVGLQSYPKF